MLFLCCYTQMLNTESGLLVAVMTSVCCGLCSHEVNTDKLHGLCVLWAIVALGMLGCIDPHRRALSHQRVCQLASWILLGGCASQWWLQLLPEDQKISSVFGSPWFLKWGLTVLFLVIFTLCRSYPVPFRGEKIKIEMTQTVCRRNASCWDKTPRYLPRTEFGII